MVNSIKSCSKFIILALRLIKFASIISLTIISMIWIKMILFVHHMLLFALSKFQIINLLHLVRLCHHCTMWLTFDPCADSDHFYERSVGSFFHYVRPFLLNSIEKMNLKVLWSWHPYSDHSLLTVTSKVNIWPTYRKLIYLWAIFSSPSIVGVLRILSAVWKFQRKINEYKSKQARKQVCDKKAMCSIVTVLFITHQYQ